MLQRAIITLSLVLLFCSALWAQAPTTSSRTRPENNQNAQGNVLGAKPDEVLRIVKLKGVVRKVDLKARSIVVDGGKAGEVELTFAQPNGREQIKTSKKIFKSTGAKKLLLEEVKTGSRVQLQYYSTLGQMLELIVESMG